MNFYDSISVIKQRKILRLRLLTFYRNDQVAAYASSDCPAAYRLGELIASESQQPAALHRIAKYAIDIHCK